MAEKASPTETYPAAAAALTLYACARIFLGASLHQIRRNSTARALLKTAAATCSTRANYAAAAAHTI
jgi:hypothetical protein